MLVGIVWCTVACVYLLPPYADNRRIGAEAQRGGLVTMLRHCWPLDGELALASHWVVMSKAEILKIVKVIACVIGFGVLGAGIGFPVALLGLETGVFGKQQGFSGFTYLIGSM